MSGSATLERLSELAGLITSYRDAWGNTRRMTEDTQRALLAAMGIDAENSDAVAATVRDLEDAPWRRPLELGASCSARARRPPACSAYAPSDGRRPKDRMVFREGNG